MMMTVNMMTMVITDQSMKLMFARPLLTVSVTSVIMVIGSLTSSVFSSRRKDDSCEKIIVLLLVLCIAASATKSSTWTVLQQLQVCKDRNE